MTFASLVDQFHVLLCGVEPAVWRIVQSAFGWSDVRRHQFVIRGQFGGAGMVVLSDKRVLVQFCFRPEARSLYHYDLADER